jgi:hypothetical protein
LVFSRIYRFRNRVRNSGIRLFLEENTRLTQCFYLFPACQDFGLSVFYQSVPSYVSSGLFFAIDSVCRHSLPSIIMEQTDFMSEWSRIWEEREKQLNLRTDLETDLAEVRHKISHLDKVLEHLAPLANMSSPSCNISDLGITDAVRTVLRKANRKLSAPEIRKELADKGYDLSSLSAPMASIYKILSRLSDEVEREKEDGGRVFFRWKHTPISDEDIPF